MNFILKMAWRDTRASRRRLLLYSLSIVLGKLFKVYGNSFQGGSAVGGVLIGGIIWSAFGFQYVFLLGVFIALLNFVAAMQIRLPNPG